MLDARAIPAGLKSCPIQSEHRTVGVAIPAVANVVRRARSEGGAQAVLR